ncbi:Hypothetical_protein [Hexamita inflata]|uniref:Hypothetical_protein n=1 Tax=Hexamita inflata TaxID=28002 RepID=A0AA86R0G7_9EUKA|nr:Hypothetical protein HINF_LOCUS57051 [Hexamita inflata]
METELELIFGQNSFVVQSDRPIKQIFNKMRLTYATINSKQPYYSTIHSIDSKQIVQSVISLSQKQYLKIIKDVDRNYYNKTDRDARLYLTSTIPPSNLLQLADLNCVGEMQLDYLKFILQLLESTDFAVISTMIKPYFERLRMFSINAYNNQPQSYFVSCTNNIFNKNVRSLTAKSYKQLKKSSGQNKPAIMKFLDSKQEALPPAYLRYSPPSSTQQSITPVTLQKVQPICDSSFNQLKTRAAAEKYVSLDFFGDCVINAKYTLKNFTAESINSQINMSQNMNLYTFLLSKLSEDFKIKLFGSRSISKLIINNLLRLDPSLQTLQSVQNYSMCECVSTAEPLPLLVIPTPSKQHQLSNFKKAHSEFLKMFTQLQAENKFECFEKCQCGSYYHREILYGVQVQNICSEFEEFSLIEFTDKTVCVDLAQKKCAIFTKNTKETLKKGNLSDLKGIPKPEIIEITDFEQINEEFWNERVVRRACKCQ